MPRNGATSTMTTSRRPSNHASDPLLTGGTWRKIRAHWIRQRQPCARCGQPIDYETTPRYWRSLDVGHIIDRVTARAAGWTDAQINALTNTQPEHQQCNREAGVRLGNQRRTPTTPNPITSRRW